MNIGDKVRFINPITGFEGIGLIQELKHGRVLKVKTIGPGGKANIIETVSFIVDLIKITSGVMPVLKEWFVMLFGSKEERIERRKLRQERRMNKRMIKAQLRKM